MIFLQVITALGKVWHIEHFTCANCNLPLGTKNFYERDGEAYCEEDYHKIFAPKCAYCDGPIVDVRAFMHIYLYIKFIEIQAPSL